MLSSLSSDEEQEILTINSVPTVIDISSDSEDEQMPLVKASVSEEVLDISSDEDEVVYVSEDIINISDTPGAPRPFKPSLVSYPEDQSSEEDEDFGLAAYPLHPNSLFASLRNTMSATLDPANYPSQAVSDKLDGSNLPIPGTRHAPEFMATQAGIKRYFNALDWLFPAKKIQEDALKIEIAVSYVDEDVRKQWFAMPEYSAAKYDEFKKAVFESYGAGTEDREHTPRELEEKLNIYRANPIYNKSGWVEFKRVIMHVLLYLIKSKDITEKTAIESLVPCILGPTWASIQVELKRMHPTPSANAKTNGMKWTLNEVSDAISSHFGDMNIFASTSRVKTESLAQQTESLSLLLDKLNLEAKARMAQEQTQARQHEQLLAAVKEALRGNPTGNPNLRTQHMQYDYTQEPLSYPATNGSTERLHSSEPSREPKTPAPPQQHNQCFFCGEEGHFVRECVHQKKMEAEGWIYKPNGVKYYFLRNGVSLASKAKAGIWPAWQVWNLMEKTNGKLPPEASAMLKTQSFIANGEDDMFSPQTILDADRVSDTQSNFD
ncbi:hypothetical protein BDZ89DRAFT_1151077 [Hymenopellis radicata]|nr:hypothetical protein BDZ89DRAFT_1151077 [Hymenopellis radicata]